MDNELEQLKECIESTIVSERNHIFKYTSPLLQPNSSQAKTVFLEYSNFTANDRYHNYNVQSSPHPYESFQFKEREIPNFYQFIVKKLHQNDKSHIISTIVRSFSSYDEEGHFEDILFSDYEFYGHTDHKIFKTWLLLNHLFEIKEQIMKTIETKKFNKIQGHLELINTNFGFLMGQKNSHFQLKMNEEELYSWLLFEIESFKHQVECKGLWNSLNKEPEKHFQRVFSAVLGRICEVFDVDMSPEPDVGSGIVDFKFSQGNNSKVCVELKLSSNSKVIEGYKLQLTKYCQSEKINTGIYVVLDSGTQSSSYRRLLSFINEDKNKGNSYPDIILINATEKPSASKLKFDKNLK